MRFNEFVSELSRIRQLKRQINMSTVANPHLGTKWAYAKEPGGQRRQRGFSICSNEVPTVSL